MYISCVRLLTRPGQHCHLIRHWTDTAFWCSLDSEAVPYLSATVEQWINLGACITQHVWIHTAKTTHSCLLGLVVSVLGFCVRCIRTRRQTFLGALVQLHPNTQGNFKQMSVVWGTRVCQNLIRSFPYSTEKLNRMINELSTIKFHLVIMK